MSQKPEVTWAQRSSASEPEKNYVFITINVPDVPKDHHTLELTPTTLNYLGESTSKKTKYQVTLDFFAEIDPENSKINHTAANTQLILRKKELKEEYWPRLLKDKARTHFLRTDFSKWVDEEEQDVVPDDDVMGGGAVPDGDFSGIDFSKLGGMGGAGGMPGMEGMMGGMGGMGADGNDDDDDDDDEGGMPELEDEKPAVPKGEPKGKSKIEEVA